MAFGLKLAKVDQEEIDRKVNHAAELLELSDLLDRKPANLSGGQRQPAEVRAKLQQAGAGRDLIMGIRPEHSRTLPWSAPRSSPTA